MAKNPQFTWQPLRHSTKNIRLIELVSAKSKHAPIRLKLATYSLDGYCPGYEAISYTWGDALDEEEIIIGEESVQSSRKLRIRKNLYHCLKRLRQTTTNRYLWVDGICIDQRNNDEKGAQVSIMGKIFSGAQRVLVWLGEVDDGSDTILAKATKRKWWAFGASFCIPTVSKKAAAQQMSEKPYWSRTWIVQEIVSAQAISVHYGGAIIDWGALRLFAELCGHHGDLSWKFDTFDEPRRAWHLSTNIRQISTTLMDHIEQFSHLQCQDVRDKVYALLSISAPPISGKALFPDYRISSAELVCRVCEHYPPMIKDGVEMRSKLAKILDVSEDELAKCIRGRGGVHLNRPLHRRVFVAGKTAMSITKHAYRNLIPDTLYNLTYFFRRN
ncbi:hypothetical protein A1O7_08774 [Cladophialophora yegresii CBS 114405]|uniref:Heterokaryon incompatibility domain-containing protein n=1 Tax=Cladophialophora yegresii CBS 114405 TaxID=1182544 RepID=W9VK30_9EURO|nr:uncharacterized protein A1O7_08774 [Cladophialophora yegresii CBS 114405]EXJ55843.1 hypothetical protein A1O7_08774 [Cladophialophora yegresii CBS 114405]